MCRAASGEGGRVSYGERRGRLTGPHRRGGHNADSLDPNDHVCCGNTSRNPAEGPASREARDRIFRHSRGSRTSFLVLAREMNRPRLAGTLMTSRAAARRLREVGP